MIQFDNATAASNTAWLTTSPQTWKHECKGTDRCLVVYTYNSTTATTVTGITYNSVALTNLITDTSNNRFTTWYLLAPALGSNNITVTFSGSPGNVYCAAASYTGVKTASATDTTASTQSNAKKISITLTTTKEATFIVGCTPYASNIGDDSYTIVTANNQTKAMQKRGTMNSAQGGRVWDSGCPVPLGANICSAEAASGTQDRRIMGINLLQDSYGGEFILNMV